MKNNFIPMNLDQILLDCDRATSSRIKEHLVLHNGRGTLIHAHPPSHRSCEGCPKKQPFQIQTALPRAREPLSDSQKRSLLQAEDQLLAKAQAMLHRDHHPLSFSKTYE
jgi:hypothetical protein